MFSLINRPSVNPIMAKFIRDSTNKSLEKYKNNVKFGIPNPPNFFILSPFLSLSYFLAGYRN